MVLLMRLVILFGLLMSLGLPVAQAKWFHRNPKPESPEKQLETFQPPPEDAMERDCEPIRQEAVRLNQQFLPLRALNKPRIGWLKQKHRRCTSHFMDQEWQYLKHVDIQKGPKLPKLETSEPASDTVIGPVPEQTPEVKP